MTAEREGAEEAHSEEWVTAVESRLLAEFVPPLEPEAVRRCLSDCLASFLAAPVRDFMPVLVERSTRRTLRARLEAT